MTEEEWFACTDVYDMLEYLREKVSDRKLRLFAIGCVRSILHLLPDQKCREAVDLAEAFAEDQAALQALRTAHEASEIEMNSAWLNAGRIERGGMVYFASKRAALACDFPGVARAITVEEFDSVAGSDTIDAIAGTLSHSAIPPERWGTAAGDNAAEHAVECERPQQLRLVHEVFGNPFRLPTIKPAWVAWNGGTVVKLARGIYDDRAFDRLPVLADALEEAGCDNPVILNHCRQPGPHVRGCWVVDLLLGKA